LDYTGAGTGTTKSKNKDKTMQKTKYVEVKPSERLPVEKGEYLAVIDMESMFTGFYPFDPEDEHDVEWWKETPEYWLLEVPDYEEEMNEMLESILYDLENKEDPWRTVENHEKIKTLLTKLKTES
jgi:hypothetical protein